MAGTTRPGSHFFYEDTKQTSVKQNPGITQARRTKVWKASKHTHSNQKVITYFNLHWLHMDDTEDGGGHGVLDEADVLHIALVLVMTVSATTLEKSVKTNIKFSRETCTPWLGWHTRYLHTLGWVCHRVQGTMVLKLWSFSAPALFSRKCFAISLFCSAPTVSTCTFTKECSFLIKYVDDQIAM